MADPAAPPSPTPEPTPSTTGNEPTLLGQEALKVEAPAPEPAPKTADEVLYPDGEKPAGEEKPEAEKPEGETPESKDPAKPVVDPAAYDIKLPDGFEVADETMTSFKDLAAKAGLDNAGAQELMDLHAQTVQSMAAEQVKAWETTITGWKAEIAADPQLQNQQEVLTAVGRAIDSYGTPEVRQAFDVTGAGWNPAIVKFVYSMAKALNEGGPVPSGRPASRQATTLGQALYPEPS